MEFVEGSDSKKEAETIQAGKSIAVQSVRSLYILIFITSCFLFVTCLGRTVIRRSLHQNILNDIVVQNRLTRSQVTNLMTKTMIHHRTTMMKTKVGRHTSDNRGVQFPKNHTSFPLKVHMNYSCYMLLETICHM